MRFFDLNLTGTSHKMLQKLRPATIATANQRQMVTTKHLKDNIPTSVGTHADWPVLGWLVGIEVLLLWASLLFVLMLLCWLHSLYVQMILAERLSY